MTEPDLVFDNLPNRLTLLRMLMVPLVVGLLFLRTPSGDIAATICFAIASITDWFDGYFARRRQIVTIYGKLMDPLADKFLVVSTLIMLLMLGRIHPIVVILLICREIAVTGLRALASAEGVVIEASRSGKWKTGLQMVALGFLMVKRPVLGLPTFLIGTTLIYLSLAMSLWSAKDYVVEFFRNLGEARKQRVAERRHARAARLAARAARLAAKAQRKPD